LPPDEVANKVVGRLLKDLDRRAKLPDAAFVHDRDHGGQAQRLLDVVGHENDRLPGRPVNAG
jgi:hypothetical protein